MIADAGILDLREQIGLVTPGIETGDSTGYALAGTGSIATNVRDVLAGEGVYMALPTTGNTGVGGAVTNQSISVPAGCSSLTFDLSLLTNELDQSSTVNDTVIVTLVPANEAPVEIYRATVGDMWSGVLPIPGAPPG